MSSDIALAEATGWRSKVAAPAEACPAGEPKECDPGAPCDHLGANGCTFPSDLRPYGCTAYICKYMHANLSRASLARIKHHLKNLEDQYDSLLEQMSRRIPYTQPAE